jgi:hypothetical protein
MRIQAAFLIVLFFGLVSTKNLQGQYISRGQAVGIIAGIAIAGAGVGVGVTYLILHNRRITTGCVAESGGRKILTTESTAFSLIETGPSLAPGERYKLKGQKSGPSSARTFMVDKMLQDLGRCP